MAEQQGSVMRWVPVRSQRLDSRDLFRRSSRVTIEHGDEVYQLCRTRTGKLILTK
jgi:hemin uptake protein HemP